ncbi:MAG: hypothetical protein ABIH23_08140, partial [bacterium]
MQKRYALTAIFALLLFASISWAGDTLWELQALNADGTGSHPKVDAAPDEANKVVIEGISLASTGEIDTPNAEGFQWFSLWLQADAPQGGIQVWTGPWSIDLWQGYSVQAGDRVRVEGWVANHNGKVFVNDRHSIALMWSMEVLSHGNMPEPEVIPGIAACNFFDQTRQLGAEKYQARWVRLNGVHIVSGEWGAGNELTITDSTGGELIMLLSSEGDFNASPVPIGSFNVVGILDQEDLEAPFYEGYRLWVKNAGDIMETSG